MSSEPAKNATLVPSALAATGRPATLPSARRATPCAFVQTSRSTPSSGGTGGTHAKIAAPETFADGIDRPLFTAMLAPPASGAAKTASPEEYATKPSSVIPASAMCAPAARSVPVAVGRGASASVAPLGEAAAASSSGEVVGAGAGVVASVGVRIPASSLTGLDAVG